MKCCSRPLGLITFVFILLMSSLSQAENYCAAGHISLQVWKNVDLSQPFVEIHSLASANPNGGFITPVQFELSYGGPQFPSFDMTFYFKGEPDMVSLPYQIIGLQVVLGDKVIFRQDFSDGCQRPLIPLFPGQSLQLPRQIYKGAKDSTLQIFIWGLM